MKRKLNKYQWGAVFLGIGIVIGVGIWSFYPNIKPGKQQNQKEDLLLENRNNSEISRELQTKYEPVKIETSNVKLTEEESSLLHNDIEKVECYKRLIMKCNPSSGYRERINDLLKQKFSIDNICICYNFLNDHSGSIYEMKQLLLSNQGGKEWKDIFKEYKEKNKEFTPTDFPKGFLEKTLGNGGLEINDVMVADEVAQKKGKKIEEFLGRRKRGESWSSIKEEQGIVNLEEKYLNIALTTEEVEMYKQQKGMTEEQVIDCLTVARKSNVKDESVLDAIRDGKSKEETYSEIYLAEYGI